MGDNWQMGGNYPPGLTQAQLDEHLDPMHKCKRCGFEFTSDEVDPDTGICDSCAEQEEQDEHEEEDEDS